MASSQSAKTIEEVWPIIQNEIDKIIDMVESAEKQKNVAAVEAMNIYSMVYNICNSKPDEDLKRLCLYERYNKVFEDYISCRVLPCLVEKEGEDLLQEVLIRWDKHKLMTRWMNKLFCYLDRYFVIKFELPALKRSSYSIFHKLVIIGIDQIMESIMHIIDRANKWVQIDDHSTLQKTVVEMWVEIQKNNFSLNKTHQHYYLKALNWIQSVNSFNHLLNRIESMIPLD